MHGDAYIGGRTENNINASCMMISDGRTKQLDIFCRVTGFMSEFFSFIVVELIWFFHEALQLSLLLLMVVISCSITLQQQSTVLLLANAHSVAQNNYICEYCTWKVFENPSFSSPGKTQKFGIFNPKSRGNCF